MHPTDVLAQIDDFITAVFHESSYYILSKIVDIALDGADDQCSFFLLT